MKTKNGIEFNLKESEYKVIFNGFIFYFSSELYKNKFNNLIENFIELEEIKLKTKYKVKINLTNYLAIALYKRIEKRGFLIKDDITKEFLTNNIEFVENLINY